MEEKVLVKSKRYEVEKIFVVMMIIGAILSAIWFAGILAFEMPDWARFYDRQHEDYLEHYEKGFCYYGKWETDKCSDCEEFEELPPKIVYAVTKTFDSNEEKLTSSLTPLLAFSFVGGLVYFWLIGYELTVTNKRIYGKVALGKRVDLPVDSVSATALVPLFEGISVSTSSGRISFLAIKNADEIYKVISDLLIERQQEKANAVAATAVPQSDEADQLKKYKELLDGGVITQEEFDAKKKQLLGL